MKQSLVTDRIRPSFDWLCRKSLMNIRSIIDIAVDLFTSEDQYFMWIATVPLFTIPFTIGNPHACINVTLASRQSPNLWPGLDHRYSTARCSYCSVNPLCFQSLYILPVPPAYLVKTHLQSIQSLWKTDFFQHRWRTMIRKFFLDRGDCVMTFHIKHVAWNFHYNLFLNLDVKEAY